MLVLWRKYYHSYELVFLVSSSQEYLLLCLFCIMNVLLDLALYRMVSCLAPTSYQTSNPRAESASMATLQKKYLSESGSFPLSTELGSQETWV